MADDTGASQADKILVGWREWVSLPDLGIRYIRAKIDTGARTSALHVEWMKIHDTDSGHVAEFETIHGRRRDPRSVVARAPVIDERMVRSSSGQEELRVVVRTTLRVQGRSWPISMTLTSRSTMKFPMLLGRRALADRFIIDPSLSFVMGKVRVRREGSSD